MTLRTFGAFSVSGELVPTSANTPVNGDASSHAASPRAVVKVVAQIRSEVGGVCVIYGTATESRPKVYLHGTSTAVTLTFSKTAPFVFSFATLAGSTYELAMVHTPP